MLYDHPLNCICKSKSLPELKSRKVAIGAPEIVYYYECPSCKTFTFATKREECCRELWNGSILHRTGGYNK